jgi:arginine decarboxylase
VRAIVPSRFFLTSGVGVHKHELMSFELALDRAGIENCNLVKTSSVIPLGCKLMPGDEARELLVPGQVTFAVYARASTPEPGRLIAAALGLALPEQGDMPGYISEVEEGYRLDERSAGEEAERIALEILASRRKVKFDIGAEWDRRKRRYRIGREDVRTRSIAAAAVGDEQGRHTTVIAAAVFLL